MTDSRSKVFAETYLAYLEQIKQIDFLTKAAAMGVERDGESLIIPLYDIPYRFNTVEGITGPTGAAITPAIRVMICKYILTTPVESQDGEYRLVTYREFKNSSPLISYFTNNTNKTIENEFSGKLDILKERGLAIGAVQLESETYDLSLCFYAFPRIPVIVNFNDCDEMFPAGCSVLYRSSASLFLDMESLAMTGTLLTGKLLAS